MSDADRLAGYVEVWWQAIHDFTRLLEKLPAEAWSTPTDLPGWDVHAVAAHTAHLEAMQAGQRHEQVDIGDAPHARGLMGSFTEEGVVARRGLGPDELITQVRACATARHTALLADPPTDGSAPAPEIFGAIGWTVEHLLRSRALDVWMHEQDVRRAVDRPGNLDGPAAVHAADYLAESLGYVLAKRVGAAPGTSAVLEIESHPPYAVVVGEDGRGEPVPTLDDPTVRLRTDRESFILLAGGRRQSARDAVAIDGDTALGGRLVEQLAVTP